MWPDSSALQLLEIDLPIIQAPMAGPVYSDMVIAVSEAGGLGSLPCAMMGVEQVRSEWALIRKGTSRSVNLNFFCHATPDVDAGRLEQWRKRLERYYQELSIDSTGVSPAASRNPFDDAMCRVVEDLRPQVVSFHFGLPESDLVERVKAAGAKVLSSATTVAEAKWLEARGCDAIIAQGFEAGGHRGMFLTADVATQVGTIALVPQIVDAVKVPVIAAGGIADARGIVAAIALGAAAVQIGTAYLFCPEARLTPAHRQALRAADDDDTVLTNVFTGRPARGVINRAVRELGPMSAIAPGFPLAAGDIAPLRAKAEKNGSIDFSPLWSGQSGRLSRETSAGELTRRLAAETRELLKRLGA